MAETLYRYGIKITPKGNHNLQFRKPKLELGTVATDWLPAPEDPDEDLYEKFTILQTDLSVVQGEIQAKVWETDIEKATDGLYESINEMYSYINETVNSIVAEVGDLIYSFEGDYESLTAQISDLIITSTEITTRVYNIEQELGTGSNLLAYTRKLDGDIPCRDIAKTGSSTVTVSQWTVANDISLPDNVQYYAKVKVGIASSSSGDYYTGFHWKYSQNVIDTNKMENGKTYTFSFYVYGLSDTDLYILYDYMISNGQTITRKSTSSYIAGSNAMWVPQSSNLRWHRIDFAFTYDSNYASSFQIGPAWSFGTSTTEVMNQEIFFCGFMLNEGNSTLDWDDGESDFATKNLLYSEIEQLSDSITAKVVDLETDVNGQITGLYSEIEMLSDSITAIVADLEGDVSSQIQQLANSISLKVTSATNGSASIIMTVDGKETGSGTLYENGLRNAFANDTSAITISAGTITFNSNTFIVNSSYFSVTADGHITATAGLIGGWTIATNGLYSGPTSISDTTEGIYMGPSGFRFNGDGIGVAIKDGEIDFYNYDEVVGYIKAYKTSWGGVHHLRITASDDAVSGRENTLQLGGPSCTFQVYDESGTVSSGAYCPTYTGIMDLSSMTYPRFRVVNGLVMQ